MAHTGIRLNGRKITSASQLQRELMRSLEKGVEESLKKAADPGVRLKKTHEGYTFEGTPEQIERMKKRLR